MNRIRLKQAFALIIAISLAACGSSSSHGNKDHHAGPAESPQGENSESGIHTSASGLFSVKFNWDSQNLVAGQAINQVHLEFFQADSDTPAEAVELIGFHPYMPGHGHGTNESAQTYSQVEDESHTWLVGGIYFSMGGGVGEWVVRLVAELDGVRDEVNVPIAYEVR